MKGLNKPRKQKTDYPRSYLLAKDNLLPRYSNNRQKGNYQLAREIFSEARVRWAVRTTEITRNGLHFPSITSEEPTNHHRMILGLGIYTNNLGIYNRGLYSERGYPKSFRAVLVFKTVNNVIDYYNRTNILT